MSDFTVDDRTERLVPRTTAPRDARGVAAVEQQRSGLPVGLWGMAIVAASEVTLFGVFVGSYFYLRFGSAHWPPDGIAPPALAAPLIMVAALATTAVPMLLAARAATTGRLSAVRRLVVTALVVQTGYFIYAIHELELDLHRFTPKTDAYGSIYFVLLGADHAHVLFGLLLDVWLLLKLTTGLTPYRATATRAIALYWLAVIAITIVVTGTVLSAAA